MKTRVIKSLITSVALLFLSSTVFSAIFIDVSEFKFPVKKKQDDKELPGSGIRVCVFDTQKQEYISICYFQQPYESSNRKLQKKELPYCFYDGLTIQYNGNVVVLNNFDPDSTYGYIVRTLVPNGVITSEGKKLSADEILRNVKEVEKSGNDIYEALKSFEKGGRIKKNFKANFFTGTSKEPIRTAAFFELTETGRKNNEERRNIGEFATEYTMLGYGYTKFISQSGSDTGFDGVFIKGKEMFLTESKCHGQYIPKKKYPYYGASAEAIMKKCLNKDGIKEKMESLPMNTREKVRKIMYDSDSKIFKFAHRIKPDGTCQCLVEVFDGQKNKVKKFSSSLDSTKCIKCENDSLEKVMDDLAKRFGDQYSLEDMIDQLKKSVGKCRISSADDEHDGVLTVHDAMAAIDTAAGNINSLSCDSIIKARNRRDRSKKVVKLVKEPLKEFRDNLLESDLKEAQKIIDIVNVIFNNLNEAIKLSKGSLGKGISKKIEEAVKAAEGNRYELREILKEVSNRRNTNIHLDTTSKAYIKVEDVTEKEDEFKEEQFAPLTQEQRASADEFLNNITERYIQAQRYAEREGDNPNREVLWGGDIELGAIANVLGLRITVYRPAAVEGGALQNDHPIGPDNGRPINLWYAGNHYENYNPVTRRPIGGIPNDGNCLFHAVLRAVHQLQPDVEEYEFTLDAVRNLRQQVADNFEEHIAEIDNPNQNPIRARFATIFEAENRNHLRDAITYLPNGALREEALGLLPEGRYNDLDGWELPEAAFGYFNSTNLHPKSQLRREIEKWFLWYNGRLGGISAMKQVGKLKKQYP